MADAMANINALIAQGPKPIQLNDQLGQMAKMYQIKSAQQELTANEQKLAEVNALREFLKSNPDLTSSATLNKLTTGFGPTGLAYGTKLLEIEKARRAERTAEQKLVDDKTKYFRDALSGVNTPDDARMWTAAIYSDPNLGPVFKGMGVTAEQAIARIPTDPAQFENWKRNAALGATKFAELNKPQFFQQDLGGSRRIIAMPGMGGAAEVVPGSAADKTAPPRYAINPVTGVSELLSSDTVRPAGGQPGAAPLVPGIAPAGQPVVTPTARPPLDMMQAPAFQELVRRGVVSTPQEAAALAQAMSLDAAGKPVNITVPNALAGAPVNAMAGVAPSGLTPVLQRKYNEQRIEAQFAPIIEYGKQSAQAQVKKDTDLANIAEKAVQSAESANRIIGLVQQGNILTGPAANIKLNIARALNVTGADNSQLISNTEKLIAATGQSTLDAIKGAGLGTGQGFTDKDLKFLQGVAGGTIDLTKETITELARLQHRAAVKSAEKWNKRVTEIPENARAAANLSTEPIIIPPLLQSRPAGAGADWTLMNDAKGNRAWVSPDKTKFIEVK
jgi:hypothetical protein